MSRKRSHIDGGHGIRLPGSLLDELKTSNGDGDQDSRFNTYSIDSNIKHKSNISRKDKRKQEKDAKRRKKSQKTIHQKPNKKFKKSNGSSSEPKSSLKSDQKHKSLETERELSDSDDQVVDEFEGFQDVDDDDVDEDDFDSDDFGDIDDSEPEPIKTVEETMKALMELKKKKAATSKPEDSAKSSRETKKSNSKESVSNETANDKKSKRTKHSKEVPKRKITSDEEALLRKDEEDIKYYAKKLGLKGSSKLTKENDGLDELFDGLDFLDDYNIEEGYDEREENDPEGDSDDGDGEDGEVIENPFSDDDEINSSDFDSDTGEDEASDEEEGEVIRPAPKENPYVAPVAQKYIPPALRQKLESSGESEQLLTIKRLIKGPLNKLSEANIMSIVNEINAIYLGHPRQLVTECLTSLVLESIVQQARLLDTFVLLHGALVSAIYRLQGVEFGAYLIQTLVEKYDVFHKDGRAKECGNLLSLLTSTYSFQVVSCKLLYNLIGELIEDPTEMNSELLLRIVKNAGLQMRNDDPSALKEIILSMQKNYQGREINSRAKFLIETITNLKNNKSNLGSKTTTESIVRMKKVLATINHNKFHEPLHVSLDDIHSVKTKGKWWLVGSAWKGNNQGEAENVDGEELHDILENAEPDWLTIAKAQRMNTDVRRAIFISIMSSNDYIEAFTKLDKLRLKRSQEREIPKILLHCVSIEKLYNPYYGYLANKLCSSHSIRKSLQFALWDFIREIEGEEEEEDYDNEGEDGADNDYFKRLNTELTEQDGEFQLQRIVNFGKLYGNLIGDGSVPLHSLKNLNFLTFNSDMSLFTEVLLITFFDNIGKKSEISTFGNGTKRSKASDIKFQDNLLVERLSKISQENSFLRGLQYFVNGKIHGSDIISGKRQRRRVEWGVDATSDICSELLKQL